MATNAFGVQPQESNFFGFDRFTADEFGLVTILAGFLCMGAGERIPGQGMIELFFVKADNLEIQSVVVAMAFGAFFTAGFGRGMVALVQDDPGFDFRMTGQASGIRNLVAEFMAFRAVRHSLKVAVNSSQATRGDLGMTGKTDQQDQ
jgi:hypothetical protein